MYHDQGHIPLKVKGFVYNKELKKWDAVAGVNVTLGIPVIRAVSYTHLDVYKRQDWHHIQVYRALVS